MIDSARFAYLLGIAFACRIDISWCVGIGRRRDSKSDALCLAYGLQMQVFCGFTDFSKLNQKVGLLFCQLFLRSTLKICRRGETGIRKGFKIPRRKLLTGSIPVGGTIE